MNFDLDIHGLGKLDNLRLQIRPLTVIAGENSTGKSFATKSIYCVLDALNQNHLVNTLRDASSRFLTSLRYYEINIRQNIARSDLEFIESTRSSFLNVIDDIAHCLEDLNILEHGEIEHRLKSEKDELLKISESIDKYFKKRGHVQKIASNQEELMQARKHINEIYWALTNHKEAVANRIAFRLSDNFKKNYQVTELQSLINVSSNNQAKINFQNIGELSFSKEGHISFNFAVHGIDEIQKLESVIFIDSPVYLRIRSGLEAKHSFFQGSDKYSRKLKGYPEYIDNLYRFVDEKYIDPPEPEFKIISERIQGIVSGRLALTKGGDINYVDENDHATPLSLTATGISNLGLIDLLVRNHVIRKGSFLIIDEPEAHIHPKWQVELMEVLFDMAQAGVNVIIATHSLDMIKKLQLLAKHTPMAEDLISIHKMPESEFDGEASLNDRLEDVLNDLSTPFYEMYMEDLT